MPKAGRAALALVVAVGVLLVMAWFDTMVVVEAGQRAQAIFDSGQAMPLWSLGLFAISGSVLLLGMLAWRSRSTAVGAIYLVVGGFFALLPWILISLASSRNDVPPALPEPLAIAVGDVYVASVGPLKAVLVIGAGMAIAGVAVIARSFLERTGQPVPH
jgi:hypothetical protein